MISRPSLAPALDVHLSPPSSFEAKPANHWEELYRRERLKPLLLGERPVWSTSTKTTLSRLIGKSTWKKTILCAQMIRLPDRRETAVVLHQIKYLSARRLHAAFSLNDGHNDPRRVKRSTSVASFRVEIGPR